MEQKIKALRAKEDNARKRKKAAVKECISCIKEDWYADAAHYLMRASQYFAEQHICANMASELQREVNAKLRQDLMEILPTCETDDLTNEPISQFIDKYKCVWVHSEWITHYKVGMITTVDSLDKDAEQNGFYLSADVRCGKIECVTAKSAGGVELAKFEMAKKEEQPDGKNQKPTDQIEERWYKCTASRLPRLIAEGEKWRYKQICSIISGHKCPEMNVKLSRNDRHLYVIEKEASHRIMSFVRIDESEVE